MPNKIKLFLPSLVRGVYRYDQLITNGDNQEFANTKWAFLPNEYKGFFGEKLKFNIIPSSYILTLSENGLSQTLASKKLHFFNKHQSYFTNWKYPKNQIYYLEVQFVEKILIYLFKIKGLDKFEPQKQIGGYFVHFAIQGDKKYVIELDGFGKFKDSEKLENFLQRQNYLVSQGWTIHRYSHKDVMSFTDKIAKQIFNIFKQDKQLCNFIESALLQNLADEITSSSYDVIETINLFYAIQDIL